MNDRLQKGDAGVFHRFRLALTRYGRAPDGLDPAERVRIDRLADAAYDLERRVLSSPEAAVVQISDECVDDAVDETETACGGADAFSTALAANGLDREGFTVGVLRELTFDGVMRSVGSRVKPPPPEEIREFYERNTERFRVPETRTVRHILITVNPDFEENRRDAAARRIEGLARHLRQAPEDFEKLAREHSECPTALEGGLVGTCPRGVLFPEIEAEAFSRPPGTVAGPVETEMGFHLVLCEDVRPEGVKEFREVEQDIRAHLEQAAQTAAQRAWLSSLPQSNSR